MGPDRRFALGGLGLGAAALAHALLTWPRRSTAVLFLGGALLALVAEAAVVRLGLLRHHREPRVAGVPVAAVAAWPGVVYHAYRAAMLLVDPGVGAAALGAVLAAAVDLAVDPVGVRAGHWSYPDSAVSTPRFRGVPWWNAAGWLAIVFAGSMLVVLAG